MATIPLRPLEVVGTISGNSPHKIEYREAATQTFKKGALVRFDASGMVVEAGDNASDFVGVAEQDGHGYTSAQVTADLENRCVVTIANNDTIFCGNLSASSVTALTDVGFAYGLAKTGDNWHVTKSVSNRRARIMKLDPRDAVGDTNGRVHFQILSNFSRLSFTS